MFEMATLPLSSPLLYSAPRGDGHPVMVLPGFMASGRSTKVIRRYLDRLDYDTYCWDLGRNLGPRAIGANGEHLIDKLHEIHEETGQKVSLVGWSLGGIYARQLGKMLPDDIRQIITLGSPFSGDPRATNAWKLYQFTSGHHVEDRDHHMGGVISQPPSVPTTAIYSESDGICAWQNCMEEDGDQLENIRVRSSHCGLGHHPAAVFAIADRLAQKEGDWQPFTRKGVRGIIYPKSRRS